MNFIKQTVLSAVFTIGLLAPMAASAASKAEIDSALTQVADELTAHAHTADAMKRVYIELYGIRSFFGAGGSNFFYYLTYPSQITDDVLLGDIAAIKRKAGPGRLIKATLWNRQLSAAYNALAILVANRADVVIQ